MIGQDLNLRLTLVAPPAGVLYSLQDQNSHPVDPVMSDGSNLSLDLTIRMDEGPRGVRYLGPFVRTEGDGRRFVYFAVGTSAGQALTPWTRRGKVQLGGLPLDMARKALTTGARVEALIPGKGRDGSPSCATIKLVEWRLAE